jgi:CRP-like cAMP-binding protein
MGGRFAPESTFGFNIGDLVVTMAIILAVFSVAFQKPLASFLSDVSASLQNTYKYGDIIRIGKYEGEAIESGWRELRILLSNGKNVTIPIKKTLESPVVKSGYQGKSMPIEMTFDINGSLSPGEAKKILIESIQETGDEQSDPRVYQEKVQNECIRYKLVFTIKDFSRLNSIQDKIRSNAWYKLRRKGLIFPFGSATGQTPFIPRKSKEERVALVTEFIKKIEVFSPLSTTEINDLANDAKLLTYGVGEKLFNQGDPGESLYIVCSGKISICIDFSTENNEMESCEVTVLEKGDILGEISLLIGEPRSASAVILEESELIYIDRAAFKKILVRNLSILDALTKIMAKRQENNVEKMKESDGASQQKEDTFSFLSKIKHFFQL